VIRQCTAECTQNESSQNIRWVMPIIHEPTRTHKRRHGPRKARRNYTHSPPHRRDMGPFQSRLPQQEERHDSHPTAAKARVAARERHASFHFGLGIVSGAPQRRGIEAAHGVEIRPKTPDVEFQHIGHKLGRSRGDEEGADTGMCVDDAIVSPCVSVIGCNGKDVGNNAERNHRRPDGNEDKHL